MGKKKGKGKKTVSTEKAVDKAYKHGETKVSKTIGLAQETTSSQAVNANGSVINWNQSSGTAMLGSFTNTSGSFLLTYGGTLVTALSQCYLGWSYEFSIRNIPDLMTYAGLYDKFRIKKVKIVITPYATESLTDDSTASGTNSGTNVFLHWAIDYDSAQLLPSNNEVGLGLLMQYSTYKRQRVVGGKKIVIVVDNPRRNMGTELIGGTVVAGTEVTKNAWTDCATPTTVFFGLKAMFESITATTGVTYCCPMRIETQYTVEYKDPL